MNAVDVSSRRRTFAVSMPAIRRVLFVVATGFLLLVALAGLELLKLLLFGLAVWLADWEV